MLPPRCCRARAMCSMGSSRQRQDVTHDGAAMRTRTRLKHTQGQPRTRVLLSHPRGCAPPSQGSPCAPLEGVPKFRGWVGAAPPPSPTPTPPPVRKRMAKEEEEGGFHGNRLVSRETRGEMSAQSRGCSREGTGSPGAMEWHRGTRGHPAALVSLVPQTSTPTPAPGQDPAPPKPRRL